MVSKYQINSNLKNILPLSREVFQQLKSHNLKEDLLFDIRLCLEEALVNAVKHGNKQNARKKVFITVKFTQRRVEIVVKDEGRGFNYSNPTSPIDKKNIQNVSGRGIFLIKKLMNKVEFFDGGTTIKMVKSF